MAGRAQSSDEYWTIFESLYGTPRIHVKFLSKAMKMRPSTTSKKMRKAFDMGYIVGPHLKRKSFANFPEYVYFLECKDPLELYLQYSEDQDIVYHAGMDGFSNLWVI
ncbi:MAG: MarR family winged helix-turn-helix transcriptional regulator, partial [Candidatus Methanofastidiosia archaeon]